MYQLNLGGEDYPPGMITQLGDAIQDIGQLINNNDGNDNDINEALWKVAQEWQSICYTLRQGQQ
jgi:hypothetical protein